MSHTNLDTGQVINTSQPGAGVPNSLVTENALMMAQLENLKLREELKKLQDKESNEIVEVGGNKKKKSVPANVTSVESGIALCGRKYSLMIAPWIDNGTLNNLKGRFKVHTSKETRFAERKTWKDDVISEFHEFLPQHLHEAIENHSHATSVFTHHIQNTRSNAILAVRTKAAVIFDLPGIYFETNYDRASVPKLQNLLKVPGFDEYAFLAPILFEKGVHNVKKKGLFMNIALPRIVKTILCGRSSTIDSSKSFKVSKPQTLAELWDVTRVTPGVIAFSAILARYMLSPDINLRKKGPTTGIKWFDDFQCYKALLIPDTRKTREIIKFFNDYVFGEDTIANSHLNAGSGNAEDFDDAMRAILDDDSDSEDSICINDEHEEPPLPRDRSAEDDEGIEEGPGDGVIMLDTPSHSPVMPMLDLPSPGVFTPDERVGACSSRNQDEAAQNPRDLDEATGDRSLHAPAIDDSETAGGAPPPLRAPSLRAPASRTPSSRTPSSRAPAKAGAPSGDLGDLVEPDANVDEVQEKPNKKKKKAAPKTRKA